MQKRVATWAILLLAFFGIADSAYVLQNEMQGSPLICDIRTLTGCNVVAQSPYSEILGIPIAGYGVVFYGILFTIAALELIIFHHRARRLLQVLAGFGFLASLYFTGLQFFVINALCIYCIVSAGIALFVFLFAFLLEPLRKSGNSISTTISTSSGTHPYLSMPPPA